MRTLEENINILNKEIPEFTALKKRSILNLNGEQVDIVEFLLSLNYTIFDTTFSYKDKYWFKLQDFYTKRGTRDFKSLIEYGIFTYEAANLKNTLQKELSASEIAHIEEIRDSFKVKNQICRTVFDTAVVELAMLIYNNDKDDDADFPLNSTISKAKFIHSVLANLLAEKYGPKISKQIPSRNAIRSLIPAKGKVYPLN